MVHSLGRQDEEQVEGQDGQWDSLLVQGEGAILSGQVMENEISTYFSAERWSPKAVGGAGK